MRKNITKIFLILGMTLAMLFAFSCSGLADESGNNSSETVEKIGSITAPTEGDSWAIGSTQTITWETGDRTDDVMIKAYLRGSSNKTIVEATENDGSYEWTVNVGWADNYFTIVIIDPDTETVLETSDTFAITDAEAPDVVTTTPIEPDDTYSIGTVSSGSDVFYAIDPAPTGSAYYVIQGDVYSTATISTTIYDQDGEEVATGSAATATNCIAAIYDPEGYSALESDMYYVKISTTSTEDVNYIFGYQFTSDDAGEVYSDGDFEILTDSLDIEQDSTDDCWFAVKAAGGSATAKVTMAANYDCTLTVYPVDDTGTPAFDWEGHSDAGTGGTTETVSFDSIADHIYLIKVGTYYNTSSKSAFTVTWSEE